MDPQHPVTHYCQLNALVVDLSRVGWKRMTLELQREQDGRTSVCVDLYWCPATVFELAQCVSHQTGWLWTPSGAFMDCCALYTSAKVPGETLTVFIPWIFPKEESRETDRDAPVRPPEGGARDDGGVG